MFTLEGQVRRFDRQYRHYRFDAGYRCAHCQGVTVVRWLQPEPMNPDPDKGSEMVRYPQAVDIREFPDVPDAIAGTAKEAWACFSIGANRGAIALARAVIESTAKDKGITTGNLNSKIDALASAGLIRAGVKEAAHEVRWSGNDVAHGDLARTIDAEEAEEILGIMDNVLVEVYQSPAQAERRRAARLARQAQPTS